MQLRILKTLIRKEIKLMQRNPLIPKVILIMPVMVMLVIPLVANMDVSGVNVMVVDQDHSQLSNRIISDIDASESLTVCDICENRKEAIRAVEKGGADVILTIPEDFEKNLGSSDGMVYIEANGVNATKGMLGGQYVQGSLLGTLQSWEKKNGIERQQPGMSVINRFNATLNYRNYMIPALIVVLLIIICGFLPSLNLVSEKESGTIEAMNVTPIGKFTFVLSKLIPFWVVGIVVVTEGMLIGRLVYGLSPKGNIWAIYLASVLFSVVMSGLGLTIANKSATMLQSIFVMFACIIIFQLMSGLFTPISSMPQWAQYITYAIPPRYFIEIMRAVYLKGSSVGELWQPYVCLTIFVAGLSWIAGVTYRKQS